jgi:hypothetical protein
LDPPENIDICSACGTPLRTGAKFCAYCGARRGGLPEEPRRLSDAAPPRPDLQPCSETHAAIACGHCGNVRTVKPAGKYCRRCGHILTSAVTESAVTAGSASSVGRNRQSSPPSHESGSAASPDQHTRVKTRAGAITLALIVLTCACAGAAYWLSARTPRDSNVRAENGTQREPQRETEHGNGPSTFFLEEREEHTPAETVSEAPSIAATPLPLQPRRSAVVPKRPPPRVAYSRPAPAAVEPEQPRPYVHKAEPLPPIAAAPEPAAPRRADELPAPDPAPPYAQGRTSVQVETMLRGARTIDQLYQQRAAAECRGPLGFVCRESIRFGLCRDKWSNREVRGMMICHVLARAGPTPEQ